MRRRSGPVKPSFFDASWTPGPAANPSRARAPSEGTSSLEALEVVDGKTTRSTLGPDVHGAALDDALGLADADGDALGLTVGQFVGGGVVGGVVLGPVVLGTVVGGVVVGVPVGGGGDGQPSGHVEGWSTLLLSTGLTGFPSCASMAVAAFFAWATRSGSSFT